MERARRQANIVGTDASGLFGAFRNVSGTNLREAQTADLPFQTYYARQQWERMSGEDRLQFSEQNLGMVTRLGEMGVWQQYDPSIQSLDQAMMVWHAIQQAKGTDAAGGAFEAEAQIAQLAAGPHAGIAGQLMGQFAARAPSANIISTMGQYNIDPQGALTTQFGGGFGVKDLTSYLQRQAMDQGVYTNLWDIRDQLEAQGAVPGGDLGGLHNLQLAGAGVWRDVSAPWNPNVSRIPFAPVQGTTMENKEILDRLDQLVRNTAPVREGYPRQ